MTSATSDDGLDTALARLLYRDGTVAHASLKLCLDEVRRLRNSTSLSLAALVVQRGLASQEVVDHTLSRLIQITNVETPELLGPYRIERELARGGMGAVFEVEHTETGARYALKTLLPGLLGEAAVEELERFRREAEVMAQLNHLHVAKIHAAELDGARPYLVQELLTGGTLNERVLRSEIPVADVARLTQQLAEGLQHCHGHGITHRDLKPQNVLFDERGVPKLVDFGLAHVIDASQRLTVSGTVMGTPSYMAPEQARGKQADARTDVYGLGALLYFMLCQRAPFVGRSVFAILGMVVEDAPQPPSSIREDVPAWLEAVCLQALSKAPADRYPDMHAFADALKEPTGPTKSTRGLVTILLLVCAALSAVLLTDRDVEPRPLKSAPGTHTADSPAKQTLEEIRGVGTPAEVLAGTNRSEDVLSKPLLLLKTEFAREAYFLADDRIVWSDHAPEGSFWLQDLTPDSTPRKLTQGSGIGLAVTRDRQRFALAGASQVIVMQANGENPRAYPVPFRVTALSFLSDDRLLVGGESKEGLLLLNTSTGTTRSFPEQGLILIRSFSVSPDGSKFVTIARYEHTDRLAKVWSTSGGPPRELDYGGSASAFSPDGDDVALGYKTGLLARHSLTKADDPAGFTDMDKFGRGGRVHGICYTPDGKYLLTIPNSRSRLLKFELRVWDATTNQLLVKRLPRDPKFSGLDLHPDGERVLVVDGLGRIEVWSLDSILPEGR